MREDAPDGVSPDPMDEWPPVSSDGERASGGPSGPTDADVAESADARNGAGQTTDRPRASLAEEGRAAVDGEGYGGADADGPAGGRVSLVGAGPGDPDLLTRRAWDRVRAADVVLHDSLTGDDIVADLPAAVEVVDVGKRPPDRTSQAEINRLMVERAGRGEHVVRLKGGDPNVFGRGGEEAQHLAEEDVAFEVVPGISSVLAAPSVSGIPLTHRECSSSLTVITGHQTPDKEESAIDWSAIADSVAAGGTLVVLMGVSRLPENVAALRDRGVDPATPVAMVERATWDGERTVVATLGDVVDRSREADVSSPAVTIVGEVVDVRESVVDALAR